MNVQDIAHRDDMTDHGRVAEQVERLMLSAIVDGKLTSGDSIHDHEWADALGVSRTPVREALQRLQSMGLLDVAAARYTRLRSFTPDVAHQEARDWVLLHHSLTATIMTSIPDGLTDRLCRVRDVFLGRTHPDHVRVANFTFFDTLRHAAPGSTITLGATAAAYRLRLAEPFLPHRPDASADLHNGIIHALNTTNPNHAHHTLTTWLNRHTPELTSA